MGVRIPFSILFYDSLAIQTKILLLKVTNASWLITMNALNLNFNAKYIMD